MRISYLIGKLDYGGAEYLLLDLAEGLLEKGHFVQVVYYLPGGDLNQRFKDLVKKGLDLHFIKRRFKLDIFLLFRYVDLLKRTNIEIVNGIMPPCNFYGVIAALLAGIKLRFMSLMASDWDYHKRIGNFIYFHLDHIVGNHLATAYIINSEEGKKFHASKGFDEKKLVVVQNGIKINKYLIPLSDEKKKEFFRCYGLDSTSKIVGMLSRIDPMKDHKTFFEAAASVNKSCPETTFIIAGDGRPEIISELHKYAQALGLADKVIFVGRVDEVASCYRVFDVYVLSSYTEGLPNTVLEAMASGRPVVSTDVGDVSRIIDNGINGFVVPKRDPEKLAEKIIFFLKDSKIALEMGRKAQGKIKANFTIEKMVSKTIDVYSSKLN